MPLPDMRPGRMISNPMKRGSMNRGSRENSPLFSAIQQQNNAISQTNEKLDKLIEILAGNAGKSITRQTIKDSNQGNEIRETQEQSERAILDKENEGKNVPTTLRGDPDSRFKENLGSDHKTLEGNPDLRFKENLEQRNEQGEAHLTKEGTPDHRFAEFRGDTARIPYGDQRSSGPHRGNYSGEDVDGEGRPLTKEGKPDRRFLQNRNLSEEEANKIGEEIRTEGTSPPLQETLNKDSEQQVKGNESPRTGSVRPPSNLREVHRNEEEQDDENNKGNVENIKNTFGGRIELNKASFSDLMNIPKMGAKRAEAIIELRNRKMGFQSWDDLEKVPGISKVTIGNLQEYCTVSGQTFDDYLENLRNEDRNGTNQTMGFNRNPQDLLPIVEQYVSGLNLPLQEKERVVETIKRGSSRPAQMNRPGRE